MGSSTRRRPDGRAGSAKEDDAVKSQLLRLDLRKAGFGEKLVAQVLGARVFEVDAEAVRNVKLVRAHVRQPIITASPP